MAANIKNPLHNYNQYTYHFVLMMAKDTSGIDGFLDIEDIDTYMHPSVQDGGKYKPKTLNGGYEYIVVFNSMTDAEFFINRLEIESWLRSAPQATKKDYSAQTSHTQITLDISEYLTLDFVPVLQHCSKQLGVSIESAVLVLKIIFVGIPDPLSGDAPVHMMNMPALAVRITALTMSVSTTGARYVMEVFTVANSKSVLEHFGTTGRQQFTLKSDKLKDIFKTLESKLNEQKSSGERRIGNTNKIVGYRIDLDEEYANYTYAYPENKSISYDKESPLTVAANSTTISGVVHDILEKSPEIQDDIIIKNKDGQNYKFAPEVIASMVTDEQTGEDVIVVKIIKTKELISTENDGDSVVDFYKNNNAYLEYDYLYTGKNVDILRMDAEVPIALSYLYSTITHTPAIQNSPTSTLKTGPNAYASSKPKETGDILTGVNQNIQVNTHFTDKKGSDGNTPVIPLLTQSSYASADIPSGELKQSRYAAARRGMVDHLNKTVVKNELEIVGDPQILFGILYKQSASTTTKTVSEYKTKMEKNKNNNDSVLVNPDIMTGLVKVNLRAPKSKFDNINNIPTTSPSEATEFENKFSTSFWYEGLYLINTIKSVFESGKFTQTLYMTAQPYSSGGHNVSAYKTDTVEPSSKGTTTGDKGKKSDTAWKQPSDTKTPPQSNVSTNEYTGSPEYQQKLHDLEKKYDLPEGYLNTMMMVESGGNPNAKSGAGAMGPFQFMPDTAKGFGINPYDPDQSAEAAAKYVSSMRDKNGWTLEQATQAYNTGPGNMKKILKGTKTMPTETAQYAQKFKKRGQLV